MAIGSAMDAMKSALQSAIGNDESQRGGEKEEVGKLLELLAKLLQGEESQSSGAGGSDVGPSENEESGSSGSDSQGGSSLLNDAADQSSAEITMKVSVG
ncbi:hypothetical protein TRICHSKD4_3041 [Roseibium sp. TrichSKD4]|uniref:hypothetical protein n=1 Tax=Roseibium sp. TrichSKD4 TaxID=744980 RepID=UPI0001E56B1F|nr:hypothetical protein [Roseibium sp. TrichSKD4]EFO31946.1 hypothetical protein TRICHSKD4_3041 [Roseibium sp. TrichSKD4]